MPIPILGARATRGDPDVGLRPGRRSSVTGSGLARETNAHSKETSGPIRRAQNPWDPTPTAIRRVQKWWDPTPTLIRRHPLAPRRLAFLPRRQKIFPAAQRRPGGGERKEGRKEGKGKEGRGEKGEGRGGATLPCKSDAIPDPTRAEPLGSDADGNPTRAEVVGSDADASIRRRLEIRRVQNPWDPTPIGDPTFWPYRLPRSDAVSNPTPSTRR